MFKRIKSKQEKAKAKIKTNLKQMDPFAQFAELSNRALAETKEAIISRQRLTKRFLNEIEKEIQEAIKMLKFLGDHWKHGDKTDYEFMRISLDKALTSRKKERRERLLQSWKDLLALNEKRLELLKENVAMNNIDGVSKDENN